MSNLKIQGTTQLVTSIICSPECYSLKAKGKNKYKILNGLPQRLLAYNLFNTSIPNKLSKFYKSFIRIFIFNLITIASNYHL